MYTHFYGLTKEPFQTTVDIDFFFPSGSLNEASAAIDYGLRQGKGPIAITGEAGVGKTMLLQAYLKKVAVHERKITIVSVWNTIAGATALFDTIIKQLGASTPSAGQADEKISQLHELLVAERRNNRTVVLVIDDAQNMPIEIWESIRMLANVEPTLIQIVLVGRPELDSLLDRPELRPVRERIAFRARILPLTKLESLAYIQHRLSIASGQPRTLFSEHALNLIVKAANGIPRKLNILCDHALIRGFRSQQSLITDEIAKEVIPDVNGHPPEPSWRMRPRHAVVMVSLALPILFYLMHDATMSTVGIASHGQRENAPVRLVENDTAPSTDQMDNTPARLVETEPESKPPPNDVPLSDRMELSETARLLAVLLDSGRAVVGRAQTTINNPRLEDKGFSSSVFEGQLRKEFMARTRHDLHNLAVAPMPEAAKPLLLRLAFFMQKTVHNAQSIINKKGIGFKGFIPATFGTEVAELFSKDTGLRLRQVGPPGIAPRNPNNKPNEREERLLYAIQRNHPRVGDHMVEHPDTSGVHVLLPLFYNKPCLACHGSPKGEVDISGYEKEGFKDGDLGGAISITIPFEKRVAKGNE